MRKIAEAVWNWAACPVCFRSYKTTTEALACGAGHFKRKK